MPDQEEGHGHHALTREAVHELFTSERGELGSDGQVRIRGLTEDEYFRQLDQAQEYADRLVGGDTWHDARLDPDAQRRHAMADPHKSGEENVEAIQHLITGELHEAQYEATAQMVHDTEMRHLGAAAHALEDSYSNAHEFRGDAVFQGDPTAPISGLNVFHTLPGHHGPGAAADFTQGTHDHYFDKVPVGQGTGDKDEFGITHNMDGSVPLLHQSDVAAAQATAELLERYEDALDRPATADAAMDHAVDEFFHMAPGGVAVNNDATDPAFRHELERRVHIEQDQERAAAREDAQRHGQVFHLGSPHAVHGAPEYSQADQTSADQAGEHYAGDDEAASA